MESRSRKEDICDYFQRRQHYLWFLSCQFIRYRISMARFPLLRDFALGILFKSSEPVGMTSSNYAPTTETELDLCCDSNQLGYMENLNIPFNLNVNFDEIPHDRGGSSSSLHAANSSMNNKNKRPIVDTQPDANKKRFVWPDALHRDFLAAVFDIGLKYASPKEVAALMSEQDSSVTMDQMKSHIQKFMMFRERKDGEYVSYSDQERGVVATGPSYTSPRSSDAPTLPNLPNAYSSTNNFGDYANDIKTETEWTGGAGFGIAFPKPTSRDPSSSSSKITKIANTRPFQGRPNISIPPTVLLAKIDTMGEAINAQSAHLANIKQLIKKQTKLYVMLSQKANQLKATLPSDVLNPPSYNAFLNHTVRNTCSSLYPMNVVTGDSTFGLSYIDATSRNQFNDSFNYNYTANANSGPEGSSEGVVNLNYLRDCATSGDHNSNNTRNGFQFMHEMRTHMDTHRKLLLRKEDQLSQHGGCDIVSNLYVHEDSCTSGYNSITDHKYKGYVYTDEDNKLCFPNGRKPEDAPVNSDYEITGLGRPAAVNPLTIRHYNNSNNVYPSSGGVRAGYISSNSSVRSASVRSGRSGRSGRSSKRDEPSTSSVLGYYYSVSQATKAALATRTTSGNSGSSATTGNTTSSASSNGMFRPSENSLIPPAYAFNHPTHGTAHVTHTSHANHASNPVTSSTAAEGDWDSELDLESDLFSFLFDPSAM